MAGNSVFISYRRAPGFAWARLIWEELGEHGVDAFLDLESIRSAGRFDDRLLNQIASRPYFIVVLTAGTLERCNGPDDWMRREIEHAIDTGRIIVPVFIAPFEPSRFPDDLPAHIRETLAQSQGLTIYSQYLGAALEKLATEMLIPVDLDSVGLTEEDARYQSRAIREIQSLPAPTVPQTPAPRAPPSDSSDEAPQTYETPAAAVDAVTAPSEAPPDRTDEDRPRSPAGHEPPGGIGQVPSDATDGSSPAGGAVGTPPATPGTGPPVRSDVAPSDAATPAPRSASDRSAAVTDPARLEPPTGPTHEPSAEPSHGRRRLVLGVVGVVAVLVAVIAIVISISGGDEQAAPNTSVAVLPVTVPLTDPDVDQTDPPTAEGEIHDETLTAGVWLRPGDVVRAAAGDHRLEMTTDGRLRLVSDGLVVWQPAYEPTATASAILQHSDGNFVVYRDDGSGGALWASGTTALGPDAALRIVEELGTGYVLLEDAAGTEHWRRPDRPDDPAGDEPDRPDDAAEAELDRLVGEARPFVASLVDVWVVQLSAKHDGLEEDGIWDHDRILGEFGQLVDELGGDADVVLVDGGDFNLNRSHLRDPSRRDFSEWYFTLLLDDFASRDAAIDWCETNRPGDCGVRLLSADPLADPQAYFSPASE